MIGKGIFPVKNFYRAMDHLEIVVEHMVAPIWIILNGPMTYAHISGLKPIPMFLLFNSKGVGSNHVRSKQFFHHWVRFNSNEKF